jgi:ubiquinone/menaquinone biosynthesis C-methylase UbiE
VPPASASDYDRIAKAYSAENESSLLNAYYERPAMLRLAGHVTGRRILDAGCGSGPLLAALRAQGAAVAGFDGSAAMIELARRRLGDDVDLHVADLDAPLPFPDAQFDDIVASLVLHYVEDWATTLAELRRLLRPGGRLIASVNHPFVHKMTHPETDYFEVSHTPRRSPSTAKRYVHATWERSLFPPNGSLPVSAPTSREPLLPW